MTSTATTIRYNATFGAKMIRVWDVYAQQWRLYSLDERVPARILASLPAAERGRIKRAQSGHARSRRIPDSLIQELVAEWLDGAAR